MEITHEFEVNGKLRTLYLSKVGERYSAKLDNGNSFSGCDYTSMEDFKKKAVYEFTYSINFFEKGYSFAKAQNIN